MDLLKYIRPDGSSKLSIYTPTPPLHTNLLDKLVELRAVPPQQLAAALLVRADDLQRLVHVVELLLVVHIRHRVACVPNEPHNRRPGAAGRGGEQGGRRGGYFNYFVFLS